MNWCFHVALTATFLCGIVCCQNPVSGFEHNVPQAPESAVLADDDEKLTIKKIMELAHKSGLLKKVATGKASDAEITELHDFYLAMPSLKPPQGEAESWKEKTAALIEASQAAVDKDPNASALLNSATNCAACHEAHK